MSEISDLVKEIHNTLKLCRNECITDNTINKIDALVSIICNSYDDNISSLVHDICVLKSKYQQENEAQIQSENVNKICLDQPAELCKSKDELVDVDLTDEKVSVIPDASDISDTDSSDSSSESSDDEINSDKMHSLFEVMHHLMIFRR